MVGLAAAAHRFTSAAFIASTTFLPPASSIHKCKLVLMEACLARQAVEFGDQGM
jgi:hypothetical protein